jgi:hypothetical protein
VNQLQWLRGAKPRLLQKRGSALLANEKGIANLLDVLDQWQTADHVLSFQSCEAIKVLVAKFGMPSPRILGGVYDQTHWLDELEASDVKSVACPRYSGQYPLLVITHGHEPILDKCRAADLI